MGVTTYIVKPLDFKVAIRVANSASLVMAMMFAGLPTSCAYRHIAWMINLSVTSVFL